MEQATPHNYRERVRGTGKLQNVTEGTRRLFDANALLMQSYAGLGRVIIIVIRPVIVFQAVGTVQTVVNYASAWISAV